MNQRGILWLIFVLFSIYLFMVRSQYFSLTIGLICITPVAYLWDRYLLAMHLFKHGIKTEAILVEYRFDEETGRPVVCYAAPDGRLITNEAAFRFFNGPTEVKNPVGSKISIVYNSTNPKQFIYLQDRPGTFTMVLLVIFSIAFSYYFLFYLSS